MGDTTQSRNYSSTLVSVGTSATVLAARNPARNNLVLYNQSGQTVNIWFDSNTTCVLALPALQSLQLAVPPQNEINASVASGNSSVTVLQA